ncbi:SDR family oxidoreductase [Actinomadura verrucosospora]|uniref:Short-chain dehydrogenase/reductase SDR n=1 Tax=Actinomadura verrucosospora TaxID=46165 RepID=A0A7D3VTT9_ACTVE|nr:SDR family oxidoreductase [Actinomadura verrucosospora]QKG22430.1 short-chain dehydrogenase/reductase SDR [Actinomadura verrucosospora]
MTRNAVVTGGGTGIGRAIAAALAADGLDVVITGRRAEVLAETAAALGPRVRPVVLDVTDPDRIEAALPELPAAVDVLVNNAGGNTDTGRPAPDGLAAVRDAWLANLETNLVGAVLVTTALEPRLGRGGRVISIGSIAGGRGGGSYGAAKAGMRVWNAELAVRLGERGITANVIAPGLIEDTEFFGDQLTDERRAMLVEQTATKRAGTPGDAAALASFLASPGAGHLTGQVVHLNGGAYIGA